MTPGPLAVLQIRCVYIYFLWTHTTLALNSQLQLVLICCLESIKDLLWIAESFSQMTGLHNFTLHNSFYTRVPLITPIKIQEFKNINPQTVTDRCLLCSVLWVRMEIGLLTAYIVFFYFIKRHIYSKLQHSSPWLQQGQQH